MQAVKASKHTLIVGLGITGLACARFLTKQGIAFDLWDSRKDLHNADEIRRTFAQSTLTLGEFDAERFSQYQQILLSPGVAMNQSALLKAQQNGVFIRGDVDVFVEHNQKPIIAITGTNGKTTVTSLVSHLLQSHGVKVATGGNIGRPILELLDDDYDVAVLELSSFQLETTYDLGAEVACILNFSADHMDRYEALQDYLEAKLKIYKNAHAVVVNADESQQVSLKSETMQNSSSFSIQNQADFYLDEHQGECWLHFQSTPLIAAKQLQIKGQHNLANALAALALCYQAGYQPSDLLEGLKSFTGLPHRCEYLGQIQGVDVYNDSKGTNVGASIAAIESVGRDTQGKLWLLAGGVGKDQDFSPLANIANKALAGVYLFGADASLIAQSIAPFKAEVFATLNEAYQEIKPHLKAGDALLFSPACASFDQYANYMARGDAFKELVEGDV